MINVAASPLSCLNYRLTHLSLEENPAFAPDKPHGFSRDNLEIIPQVCLEIPEENLWRVKLKIKLIFRAENNFPYDFTVELEGKFKVTEWKDPQKLVSINANSLLFTAARDLLTGLTARGKNPPILLPTVTFQFTPDVKVEEQAKKEVIAK